MADYEDYTVYIQKRWNRGRTMPKNCHPHATPRPLHKNLIYSTTQVTPIQELCHIIKTNRVESQEHWLLWSFAEI